MSTVAAKSPTESDVPIRRLAARGRWRQLRQSDALKILLDEFALWMAPWTGFPLVKDDHVAMGERGPDV